MNKPRTRKRILKICRYYKHDSKGPYRDTAYVVEYSPKDSNLTIAYKCIHVGKRQPLLPVEWTRVNITADSWIVLRNLD